MANEPGTSSNGPGRLAGKVAIVTGGASGIGEAVARRFIMEGARVLVADIDRERGEELARSSTGLAFQVTDVSSPSECAEMVEQALSRFGAVDILVNNAFWSKAHRIHKLADEGWKKTLEVTLDAVFYGSRAVLPLFREQGHGVIVNTASISGLGGDDGMSAYNAAKAAVVNFTRTAALENARRGIRINCVCPGLIATPAVKRAFLSEAGSRERIGEQLPMGRLGEPDEMANVFLFLASDEASYVTGAAFVADGGTSIRSGVPNVLDRLGEGTER